MTKPSDRARRLIEELHEVMGNEKSWEIAERYLKEAFDEGRIVGRGDNDHG